MASLDELRTTVSSYTLKEPPKQLPAARTDTQVVDEWRNGYAMMCNEENFGDGRRVVIVCDEDGVSEYKVLHPDGHLGGVGGE